uniref:Uncharacterized protein n=1 Tax=Oryza sativa subsp. japonica TaxID=39947 RepID=Q6K316_ORYSJ|nr:hypothetical protein [Oryza sativa Japonica Group]
MSPTGGAHLSVTRGRMGRGGRPSWRVGKGEGIGPAAQRKKKTKENEKKRKMISRAFIKCLCTILIG